MEFAQQRRDLVDADRIRRGEAQPAARTALQLVDRAFGLAEFARDALAMLVVDVARFGEAEFAGGPVQQLRAQARFQFLHLAADRGLRQAKRLGGGDETALLDHLDEDQRVVQIVAHGGTPGRRIRIGPPAG